MAFEIFSAAILGLAIPMMIFVVFVVRALSEEIRKLQGEVATWQSLLDGHASLFEGRLESQGKAFRRINETGTQHAHMIDQLRRAVINSGKATLTEFSDTEIRYAKTNTSGD